MFELCEKRCITTSPTTENKIYHYVIKDYSKSLSDKEVYDLQTQKSRIRDHFKSKIRFNSKSGDIFTKKVYRIFYKHFSVLRKYANEFIEKFISMFFIKEIPQQKCLE